MTMRRQRRGKHAPRKGSMVMELLMAHGFTAFWIAMALGLIGGIYFWASSASISQETGQVVNALKSTAQKRSYANYTTALATNLVPEQMKYGGKIYVGGESGIEVNATKGSVLTTFEMTGGAAGMNHDDYLAVQFGTLTSPVGESDCQSITGKLLAERAVQGVAVTLGTAAATTAGTGAANVYAIFHRVGRPKPGVASAHALTFKEADAATIGDACSKATPNVWAMIR